MLREFWEKYDRFWVTFPKEDAKSMLKNETVYPCYFPTNRNIPNLIRNTYLAWKILRREHPDVLISSGAAVAVPFFWLGKLFFHTKNVYIEVYDRIDYGTLTGKLVKPVTDRYIVQWKEMEDVYPRTEDLGSIF